MREKRTAWYLVCKYIFKILPDSIFHNAVSLIMHLRFKSRYFWLNIQSPVTFSEKLQYLKLHPCCRDMDVMADKYCVRRFVTNKIGSKYLPKLIGIYNYSDEINFDDLPDSFILKCTKGSGFNYICINKKKENINKIKEIVDGWLKIDFYCFSREPQYRGKPRIICEELIQYNITDYKIFCFDGEPYMIEVISDRPNQIKKAFYDVNWNALNIMTGDVKKDILKFERPEKLDEMLEVAKKLSENIAFVRVDLYYTNSRVYFGELTFYPAGGYTPIRPREMDYILGNKLHIY